VLSAACSAPTPARQPLTCAKISLLQVQHTHVTGHDTLRTCLPPPPAPGPGRQQGGSRAAAGRQQLLQQIILLLYLQCLAQLASAAGLGGMQDIAVGSKAAAGAMRCNAGPAAKPACPPPPSPAAPGRAAAAAAAIAARGAAVAATARHACPGAAAALTASRVRCSCCAPPAPWPPQPPAWQHTRHQPRHLPAPCLHTLPPLAPAGPLQDVLGRHNHYCTAIYYYILYRWQHWPPILLLSHRTNPADQADGLEIALVIR
jgi:hypothetical protein